MRRIVVIGSSGSGKTTLARELAELLRVPHIELDALNWKPHWTATPQQQLLQDVQNALDSANDGWTLCGEYGDVRYLTWARADTIIWLDYSMTTVFKRVLRRTLRRWWKNESLWNGNRERLWVQFFHPDSLLLYVINNWRIRRHNTRRMLRNPKFAHVKIHHFHSPAEMEHWKQKLMLRKTANSTILKKQLEK